MNVADIFGDLPVLETERTLLRKITMADAYDMFEYCSDEAVSEYTTWYAHKTLEDTKVFIERVLHAYGNSDIGPWGIVDKQTSKLIGTCGFVYWNTVHARAEVGYALSRAYWNKGIMSEVVSRIIDFGFRDMQLVRLEARCLLPNIGSAKVMEKTGMAFEGTLCKNVFTKGMHHDLKLFAIINDNIE
ncbi:GNAT family protein [Paenibacillus sp. LHD-117]|uniref:GNAT family N-acetyltransferase n=1 Tax=Paenibacillus sp. LHD-117 TaxID=3071412 RepID=UPI0027E1F7A3|nr:GNAT family protein [Paenibacillus sp. LHD-117]MDQ6420594.1 GNAT family protein [Paenibacillus sp. LHD-117]